MSCHDSVFGGSDKASSDSETFTPLPGRPDVVSSTWVERGEEYLLTSWAGIEEAMRAI